MSKLNEHTIKITKQFGLNKTEAISIYQKKKDKKMLEGQRLINTGRRIQAIARADYDKAKQLVKEIYG